MTDTNSLRRLFSFAKPYRARLWWALVAMVVYAAGAAGPPALVQYVFDDVLQRQEHVALVGWALIGAFFLKGAGLYVSSYLMADVGQRVVMDLRNTLYRHILGQSAASSRRGAPGSLMSRIGNDVGQIQTVVSETVGDVARDSLTVIFYAAVAFRLDPPLTIACITGAPLVVYPLTRLGQRVRRTTRRSQEALEQLSHVSAEAFAGHRIVKAFGTEKYEADKFGRSGYHLFRTNMKVTAALASFPPLMELLGGFVMAGALWYGSRQIATGRLTTGDFISFVFAFLLMYDPVKRLSRVNANIQQALAASERIFDLLDTHSEVHEKPNAAVLQAFHGAVEFRDVTFGYDNNPQAILRGVSFRVEPGQMVAIVGRSGAGKTTLVNLLPRFYDVTTGAIQIDGMDLRDVTLASLRSEIGIVTQETVLFDDTIANNIAYGASGSSRATVEAAARAAHAHDFINGLPQGYDTVIGERGQRLSGGQRQRLAIARALLKDAPILVLDEATSALDAESEMLVQEALANLMLNRTSFVIAHRLSTIRRADAILVLERGRLVEVGRHDDLLSRPSSTYAALYQLQMLETPKPEGKVAIGVGPVVTERPRPYRAED